MTMTCKLDRCERPKRARGYCEVCYRRLIYQGKIITEKPKPLMQRITEKTKIGSSDDCWVWQGLINRTGYPTMKRNSKNTLVHRIMFEIHKGFIKDGMLICHTCDNKRCVNPEHLYMGTQKTNRQDCVRRGRTNQTRGDDGRYTPAYN